MNIIEEGQLRGSIEGFKDRDTVFQFAGGRKWKQNEYKYQYNYAYMPYAKIIESGGRYMLEIEGMSGSVVVVPA